jgi:hypothetical protein
MLIPTTGTRTSQPRPTSWWAVPVLLALVSLAVLCARPQVAQAAVTSPAFPRLAVWWPDADTQPIADLAKCDWIALQNGDASHIGALRAANPNIIVLGDTNARELNYVLGNYNSPYNAELRSASTDWMLTQVGSTLTVPITASATTIPVADVTKFAVGQMVLVDHELMSVTGVNASSLTVLARGPVDPSAAHAAGSRIAAVVSNWPGTITFDLSTNCPKRDVGDGSGPETWSDWNVHRGVTILASADWDGLLVDCLESDASWMVDAGHAASIDALRTNKPVTDGYAAFDSSWNAGAVAFGNALKAASGNKIIIGNGNMRNYNLNGNIFEEFPYSGIALATWNIVFVGPYSSPHASYPEWSTNAAAPDLTLVQTYGAPNNYQLMRFSLCSTLMSNGYFSYALSSGVHASGGLDWFDEYDGGGVGRGYLGQPTGAATKVGNAWRRDFAGGVALVNPSSSPVTVQLGGTFRKIKGTQAPTVNDGSTVTAVTIPAQDGIIVLRIPAPVTYTLAYSAGSGGTISGSAAQAVASGASGTAVTAAAASGYHFVSWSDGVTSAARTDANVTANLSVTASFAMAPAPIPVTTNLTAPSKAKVRRAFRLSGTVSVSSGHAGLSTLAAFSGASTPAEPPALDTVRITKSRLIHGKWRVTGSMTAKVVNGGFSYSFKPSYRSPYRFVATTPGGANGATTYTVSSSGAKTVKVR